MNTISLSHSDQVTPEDIEFLEQIFGRVNTKYFDGRLQTAVLWSVPIASDVVSPFTSNHCLDDVPADLKKLTRAIELHTKGDSKSARKIAIDLIDTGDSRVFELLIYCERKLGGDWEQWAKIRNLNAGNITKQACSSTEKINGMNVIRIHPRLAPSIAKKLPRYVLYYALRHEGLHQILNTKPDNPHTDHFKELDNEYDKKELALSHIKRLGFSTV